MGLREIVREEVQALLEFAQQGVYNIRDLAGLMQHMGYDKEGVYHLTNLLIKAFQKGGDDAVVEMYKGFTGTDIYPVSRGRYVFNTEPTGGGEPQLEGVGDKYAEKFGVPDSGEEFEKRWQAKQQTQSTDVQNGELIGQVYSTEDYGDGYEKAPINVYKNPQSLKNFDANARAVADKQGNIYVAQRDGNFYHTNIISLVPSIWNYEDSIQLYRAEKTNMFGVASTYLRMVFDTDDITDVMSREHIEDHPEIQRQFKLLNSKHQQFDFSYYPTYMLLGSLTPEQVQHSILREGVGDKYAEKAFGIRDVNREFEKQGVPDSPGMGKKVSDVWGYDYQTYKNTQQGYIYLNPTSLQGFDEDVRALGMLNGDLYVAQRNADFIHVDMQRDIEKKIGYIGDEYVGLHRVSNTNVFGAGDSMEYEYKESEEFAALMDDILNILRERHPAFKFNIKYFEDLKGKNLNDIVREELFLIKNNEGMAVGDNSGYMQMVDEDLGDRTPQDIADNLQNDPYFERAKANYPENYKEPVLANVDVELADEAFRRDHDFYIGPDDKGIGNRRERVLQTVEDGSLKYAPYVSIRMSHNDVPVLSFGDGRHRFAVLRDLGVKTINMTFSAESQPYIGLLQS